MEEIYKNTLLLVHSLTQLSGISYKYSEDPTDETAEKLVKIVDNCEKKFLKVKEEIVKMVKDVENKEKTEEIKGVQTENGLLIKEWLWQIQE